MNEQNRKKVWSLIQLRGDQLQGNLKSHPNHPKGRNPYAHICSIVKTQFHCSYKEIPDNKIDELIVFISNIKD